ncbi:hypothetical protein CLPUN_14220 [Clostridium puniceum]|uniref:Uncharacterized protein n=1 Tax=Clostridium puniceum TaxID=29367 RepID=A0A1S8TQH4_9CLOT|nr:hypothetical protein [Clostridium puniceum]OOM79904.1 hypothetical protein CLPUN_14220 [Clostridium puniceum]
MTIKCIECNLHWKVSIKKDIDPSGYICPRCSEKMKKSSNKKNKL